jgi:glycine/D-amino acid oxidase-like deaminating enzyme
VRQQALRDVASKLYPQLVGATWTHAWGGNVAITRDHLPGLHLVAPNVMAGLGYNGRGVGMATVMGTVLARWAGGAAPETLDFPVTQAWPIPFHGLRQIGVRSTMTAYRLLDRLGL